MADDQERRRASRRAALQRGAVAETLVATRLSAEGWDVLAQNWRGGGGEIDLVILRDGCLRFVEVKLRVPEDTLTDDAVPMHKQLLLRNAAAAWCVAHGDPPVEQAFLVAYVDASRTPWAIRLLDDAFDG